MPFERIIKFLPIVAVVVGVVLSFSSPALALAPLVPCGSGDSICQTCDILVLIKNISDFVLFYLVPGIATLFFIIGGFMILLGGGITSQVSRGQNIMRTTIYGLLVIFLAWLIVNTVLRTVAGDQNIAGQWWKLQCSEPAAAALPAANPANPAAPSVLVISAVSATQITDTTAVITWTTNQPSTSQVQIGTTGPKTILDPALVTSHSVTLTGLSPNTLQLVQAISLNVANFTAVSTPINFTTAPLGAGTNVFKFITPNTLPNAVVGQDYSLQIAMDGGQPPYTLTLRAGNVLPAGLTMTSGGLISGRPTALTPGRNFTVDARDSSNPPAATQRLFALTVLAAGDACTNPAALALQHQNASVPFQRAVELEVLLSCIANRLGQALPAEGGQTGYFGSLFTYDNSSPTCNYTRGDKHCDASCAHALNSCHYGGRTGTRGALAADFGNEFNGFAISAAATFCGAKSARCENAAGVTVNCSPGSGADHVHISAGSCDAN